MMTAQPQHEHFARKLELAREKYLLKQEQDRRDRQGLFYRLFPDEDTVQRDGSIIHAREKYQRHLEAFKAQADHREVGIIAANRVGKSLAIGGFSTASHLTGQYRDWWPGRTFEKPIRAWAAGKTNETTRDIVQTTLLGEITYSGGRKGFTGTGVIPGDCIGSVTWRQGVADTADTVKIKHIKGWSTLGFKSYQQGRGAFEGTAQELIWMDEEPPADIYGEALTRTATTNGLILMTFTPMEGCSDVVNSYLPDDQRLS